MRPNSSTYAVLILFFFAVFLDGAACASGQTNGKIPTTDSSDTGSGNSTWLYYSNFAEVMETIRVINTISPRTAHARHPRKKPHLLVLLIKRKLLFIIIEYAPLSSHGLKNELQWFWFFFYFYRKDIYFKLCR